MKKIFITLLLIFSIILIGCSSQISADTTITPETVTVTSIVEVENTDRIEKLEADNFKLETELEKYKELISGLNDLLENVYYGYASNSNWISDGFTAFSLKYDDKYYLITAGHCVHYQDDNIDTGVYTYFKVKANFNDEWIYPKLLAYENDFYNNRDYAILYSDKIESGFDFNLENNSFQYILGNGTNNTMRIFSVSAVDGESGSPVINANGEVVNISTGNITDIDIVIEAIDELK